MYTLYIIRSDIKGNKRFPFFHLRHFAKSFSTVDDPRMKWKTAQKEKNRKGVNVTANQPSQQQNEYFLHSNGLSNGHTFTIESSIIHFGNIVIVHSHYSCPGNGENSLEKFCRIFRSPAYLLQFTIVRRWKY